MHNKQVIQSPTILGQQIKIVNLSIVSKWLIRWYSSNRNHPAYQVLMLMRPARLADLDVYVCKFISTIREVEIIQHNTIFTYLEIWMCSHLFFMHELLNCKVVMKNLNTWKLYPLFNFKIKENNWTFSNFPLMLSEMKN